MKKSIVAMLIMMSIPLNAYAENAEVKDSQLVELPAMNYSRAIIHKVCVDGILFLLVEGGGLVQVMAKDENSGHIYPRRCE